MTDANRFVLPFQQLDVCRTARQLAVLVQSAAIGDAMIRGLRGGTGP